MDDYEGRREGYRRMIEAFEMENREGKLGPSLRARAEALLNIADTGRLKLSEEERNRLDRIATVPDQDDYQWLGTFDWIHEVDVTIDEIADLVAKGEIRLSAEERERLEVIAASPRPEDCEWLGKFNPAIEAYGRKILGEKGDD
jgi:hypothetical protein